MAISNLRLNVTANTARALADFNKFSRSLDNKFLVSGLKLDVVRNALSQINKDFQRAIGEQGLASASSLRAAQNQAALLTQTFKGFASESALSITQNIGTALNKVAVRAGGTMKDVQKTLAATPFISTNLSEDLRNKLAKGILSFQRDMRRAGLGENFGGVAQQFLMGQSTGMQMMQSGDAMQSFLGQQIIKRVGGEGLIHSPEERSRIMAEILGDKEIQDQLSLMAKRAAGFRIVLEDMNTYLFNPEAGVFGMLKTVVDSAGNSTNMFDEVDKLTKQVFGPEGMFAKLAESVRKIFGSADPMRFFIDMVQFTTGVFKDLAAYFQTSGFKDILVMVKETFGRVGELFKRVYDQIRGGSFDASGITEVIGSIGANMRQYIKNIGEKIRNLDDDEAIGFVSDIAGTLFEEVGKTAVVLVKELFATLIDKVPELASQVLPALNKGINSILTEAFGEVGAKIVKLIAGFIPGPIGAIARASAVGDVTGDGGSIGSMLAMGAGAIAAPGILRGIGGFGRNAFTGARNQLSGFAQPFKPLAKGARYGFGVSMGYSFPLDDFVIRNGKIVPRRGMSSYDYPISPPGPPQQGPLLPPGGIRRPSLKTAPPFINPMGMIIGPDTSMFEAIPGFFEQERARRGEFIRGNRERNVREGMERYQRSLASYRAETSAFRFYNVPEYLTRDPINFTAYDRPIGPQPHDAPWAYAPGMSDVGGDYAPFMESSYTSPREQEVRRRLAANERYKRMYESGSLGRMGRRSRIGAIASKFRPGKRVALGLGAASIVSAMTLFGGGLGRASDVDLETGEPIPQKLGASNAFGAIGGGLAKGALDGAMMGSVLGPKGAAAGAIIGGIIGGVAPLLDKGVRDGVGKFVSGIGTTMSEFGSGIVKGLNEIANNTLQAISSLPSLMGNIVKSIYNSLPAPVRSTMGFFNNVWSGVTGFVSRINLPNMFNEGKDYIGGTMALEARLSGNRPMVVNDGEFVIPRDGFPTLAGLVGENLRTTGVINNGGNQPIQVNVSLSVTANSVVADANELATVLREPVYKIVGDAWDEAVNATRVHRARVN